MRSRGIFASKRGTSLVSCLALSLWIGTASAAQGQAPENNLDSQGRPIEQIDITGRKTMIALQVEINNAEIRMFNLFNQLNDVREFEISCQAVMITGSRIAERECVPMYMKRMRFRNVENFLFTDLTPPQVNEKPSGGWAMDLKGVQDSEQLLWFKNQPKTRAFTTKFQELAADHADLAAAAQDLQAKRQRLEELEARRRTEGAVGRFLSGDKDEE
ncbi:MAG: hypothetical protein V4603_03665 [Pseudomonadota bacterium]